MGRCEHRKNMKNGEEEVEITVILLCRDRTRFFF